MIRPLLTALGLTLLPFAAVACPNPQLWSEDVYEFSGDDLYQPRSFAVVAGGENHLSSSCRQIIRSMDSDKGDGWFTTRPDFSIKTPGMNGYRLEIKVNSTCDSTLLINTPAGNFYYDDDDNGNLDPRILLTNPSSGVLDIWVGTHDGSLCEAVLTLETF